MAKQKQTVKLKEPVRIRFKQLSNGNQSIYLEYYTGDVIRKENYVGGKRKYEFLKLYLIPERTREDKAKNEATLALAKAIQSKRIVEVQNDAHGFQNTNKSRVNLLDYLENIGKQSAEQGSRITRVDFALEALLDVVGGADDVVHRCGLGAGIVGYV